MPHSEDIETRLKQADLSLFEAINTSATVEDRRSLIALQAATRHPGYTYLEIGSEMGGSLQSHLIDPWCQTIFSIDLRVSTVNDIRGKGFSYHENTTARMIAGLKVHFGESAHKIKSFDSSARDVPTSAIQPPPSLIFIDGEHTHEGVLRDFADARRFAAPNALIAFHDAQIIHTAIQDCLNILQKEGVSFHSAALAGAVYAIAIGPHAHDQIEKIPIPQSPPHVFFKTAPSYLKAETRRYRGMIRRSKFRQFLRRIRQKLLP